MRPLAAAALVALLYALHQDVWFWREARPLVFGVLPVGLFYHAAYTVMTALTMWALVRLIWPHHLDAVREPALPDPGRAADSE